jgi:putative ABC transport system ATP-binding protein
MNDAILTASFRKQFPSGPEIVATDLHIRGGVTVLFGASGSGKTTILRCLAGLERPESGTILFGKENWCDVERNCFQPPKKRGIGFVPQDYALFPHLTVASNVSYGLDELPAAERTARGVETLHWLGLDGLENRLPRELSGGQQQRVALARALVNEPEVILADEPTGNLDSRTSIEIMGVFQALNAAGITIVMVTHELDIASFCKRIIIMRDGEILSDDPNPAQHLATNELTLLNQRERKVKLS